MLIVIIASTIWSVVIALEIHSLILIYKNQENIAIAFGGWCSCFYGEECKKIESV